MFIGTSDYDFGHPNIYIGSPINMLPHLSVGGGVFCDKAGHWSIPPESVGLDRHKDREGVVRSFLEYCFDPQGYIPLAMPKAAVKSEYHYIERRAQGVVAPQPQTPLGICANIYVGTSPSSSFGSFYGYMPFYGVEDLDGIKPLYPSDIGQFKKCANIYAGLSLVGCSSFGFLSGHGVFFEPSNSRQIPFYFYRSFADTLGLGYIEYIAWYYKANILIANK